MPRPEAGAGARLPRSTPDRPDNLLLPRRSSLRPATLHAAVLAVLLLTIPFPVFAAPPEMDPAAPEILAASESLFQSMRDRDCRAIFSVLTAKSRDTIVADTWKAILAVGGSPPSAEEIRREFEEGGPLARNYWDAFLRRFDPDDALERSRWEMGPVKKEQAEVLITKRGGENPVVLQMRREGGAWKAGLVETFWTR